MKTKLITIISLTLSMFFCSGVVTQNAEAARAIKIESPKEGSSVPFGGNNDLVVSGTSADNSTSDCKVGIRINDKSPYQPATAAGQGGGNDFSTWKFTPSATYGSLKEGVNKITARLTCTTHLGTGDTTLSTKDNIRVAGVAAGGTAAAAAAGPPTPESNDNNTAS
jgi:hypothetical protein